MKRMIILLSSVFFIFGTAEIVARNWLGLGTPPLSVKHPTIEYMFAPDQDLYRFGNRQLYNEYSMRSIPLDQATQPHRILVFGDSVLNGGNLTDQSELATTLATDQITFYGNISAGSWGPANMVAWIEEYGLLGAETVQILISSHDLNDVPTFAPLNPQTHPTVSPVSAAIEGIERYLPRYLPSIFSNGAALTQPSETSQGSAVGAITNFIDRVKGGGAKLCVIHHKTQDELGLPPTPASQVIQEIFAVRGVPVLDFGDVLEEARITAYQDNIHINSHGQELLTDYLRECSEIARIPN